MTVDEMLCRMSSLELSEWMAFKGLEHQEHDLVHLKKIDPEVAHQMVWATDGADLENAD